MSNSKQGGVLKPAALLLGDSISLDYRDFVKIILQDSVEIFYPPENGRMVAYTFREISTWSKNLNWSSNMNLIYWNNGLWDIVRIFGDEPQTSINEYSILIGRTYDRLKYLFPQAKIIFATTTAVVESRFDKENFYRRNDDIQQYNEIAQSVILERGGFVHDLNKLTTSWTELMWRDSTHFILQARQVMAAYIAALIKNLI